MGDEPGDPVSAVASALGKGLGILHDSVKPRLALKQAKADAEGAVIRAEGEAAAEAVRLRAFYTLAEEAVGNQKRLEAILLKAAETKGLLPSAIEHASVSPDWKRHYTSGAREANDEELQDLWASVLAGEFMKPGTFSRRTLEALRLMSREEAEMFRESSRFVWTFDDTDAGHLEVYVFDETTGEQRRVPSDEGGIPYEDYLHLESIGLVASVMMTVGLTFSDPVMIAEYNGRRFRMRVAEPGKTTLSYSKLTLQGRELLRVVKRESDVEYLNASLARMAEKGLTVEEEICERQQ